MLDNKEIKSSTLLYLIKAFLFEVALQNINISIWYLFNNGAKIDT